MFEYRVYKKVYDDIVSGKKNIEFRLLNDKSEKIKTGDKILFKVVDDPTLNILTEVCEKYIFNNIDELFETKEILSNNVLSYTKEEFEKVFCDIFGRENVINSKIVGIKFRLLK